MPYPNVASGSSDNLLVVNDLCEPHVVIRRYFDGDMRSGGRYHCAREQKKERGVYAIRGQAQGNSRFAWLPDR